RSVRLVSDPTPEWWPFRNQLLVTIAAAKALHLTVGTLLIGTVRTDARHRDGSKRFVALMDAACKMQEGHVRLRAPAIEMSSIHLVRRAKLPRTLLGWTHSCHVGNVACGQCPGCLKHSAIMNSLRW